MPIIVTICGAGNAAHVLMSQAGSVAGVETRVLDLRSASALRSALAEAGRVITCHNHHGTIHVHVLCPH